MCKEFQSHLDEVINPTWNFSGRSDSHKDEVINAVLGLAGEAGEVTDQIKKAYFHSEKSFGFHRDKLVLELGDVFYYTIKFMDLMKISLDEVLEGNRAKLESRHPELGKVATRYDAGCIK